jgi:hypothetical protein
MSGLTIMFNILQEKQHRTIQGARAGFYVLVSLPFKVKDYVKIGEHEASRGNKHQLHEPIHTYF